MVKGEDRLHPMHAPAIGSAIDLVFFQSHRLTNQNDFAAVCAACDADVVLCNIRPALKDRSQIYDFHDESVYLKSGSFTRLN
jgi:hypothetical protein